MRIGTTVLSLPLYLFQYIWGGPTHIGVMAQDVAQIIPEAVHEVCGYLAVDYSKLYASA
jgi:hypothetical protein